MKVIIAGSRGFTDSALVVGTVAQAQVEQNIIITEVVCGMARGVDMLGHQFATHRGIPIKEMPVTPEDWKRKGRAAGIIRNGEMAEYADALIALWDGVSTGTKNMIETMKKLGKPVHVRTVRLVNPELVRGTQIELFEPEMRQPRPK